MTSKYRGKRGAVSVSASKYELIRIAAESQNMSMGQFIEAAVEPALTKALGPPGPKPPRNRGGRPRDDRDSPVTR